jgi:hypothetical protein
MPANFGAASELYTSIAAHPWDKESRAEPGGGHETRCSPGAWPAAPSARASLRPTTPKTCNSLEQGGVSPRFASMCAGLLAAIRAWQPHRGPFPAFADRCVTNQALLALETDCRHKHQLLSRAISLDSVQRRAAGPLDEGQTLALLATLPARDAGTDPESRLLVREQLASTGVRQRQGARGRG